MTDVEFFTQLHELLLEFEQVLIRSDLREIESCTLKIHQYLRTAKSSPLQPSGEDLRPLLEQSSLLLQRNSAMIQEGLLLANVMMESVMDARPTVTGNYQNPHSSLQTAPSETASKRFFDAKA